MKVGPAQVLFPGRRHHADPPSGARLHAICTPPEMRRRRAPLRRRECRSCTTFWGARSLNTSDAGRLLRERLVRVAVAPLLAGLKGTNDVVPRRVRVRRGVLADRIVTAAHVAALQALAQMHPLLSDGEALLAALRACLRLRCGNGVHVLALGHDLSSLVCRPRGDAGGRAYLCASASQPPRVVATR